MASVAGPPGLLPQAFACPAVYRHRNPRATSLYLLLDAHHETLKGAWEQRFEQRYGFWRGFWDTVVAGYLDCGLFESGFARAFCETCRTNYLIPFSCRGRSFCPSCEKKKQLLWAEWLHEEVLEPVPHRHVVLTIPRLLRGILRKRRELLLDLSQCGAEALAQYMRTRVGPDLGPASWCRSLLAATFCSGIRMDTSS